MSSNYNEANNIKKLVEFIKKLDVDEGKREREGTYMSSVLICLDAVLSINRKYYSFVVPRVISFSNNNPEIETLLDLKNYIDDLGYSKFCEVWKYNHVDRVRMLDELTTFFINLEGNEKQSDLNRMKEWANKVDVKDYKSLKIRGLGLASFQYLRLMLGAKTIKPDVHIKKAYSSVCEERISDIKLVEVIEKASKISNKNISDVDYALWNLYATDSIEPPYRWEDGKWVKNT